MLTVEWEIPDEDRVVASLRAAHVFAPLELWARDRELPILYARATYERAQYPAALEALVVADLAGRELDRRSIYQTCRYLDECCGEVWRVWPVLAWRGSGDCEDLAAARVAELRELGDAALVELRQSAELGAGRRLWHVLVRTEQRGIEDPSKLLGMGHAGVFCDPSGPRGRSCRARQP